MGRKKNKTGFKGYVSTWIDYLFIDYIIHIYLPNLKGELV